MRANNFVLILFILCTIISDYTIFNNLSNKSGNILYDLFIKQLISYIAIAIISYINVLESGGGDRTMGAGMCFLAFILGAPILVGLVDGFSYLIFYLTNNIFIYWILYLLNFVLDCFVVYLYFE